MKKIDVVVSYWKAEGSKVLADILAHFSEDAYFRSPTMELKGRNEISKYYQGMVDGYKKIDVTPTAWIEQDDKIAVEYDCHMITQQDEKRFAQGHNFFQINPKGEITKIHCYYNPADF